jgi:hypothetical protein
MDRKRFLTSIGLSGICAATAGFQRIIGRSDPLPSPQDLNALSGGPQVDDLLFQGPFPFQEVPDWQVVMTTSSSDRLLKNVGMGLVTYVIDEAGPPKVPGETLAQSIEKLAQIPFAEKMYMRLNWKDLQKERGKLAPSEAWRLTFEMAAKYNKRIGFRVMFQNPHIPDLALPNFVAKEVPRVTLGRTDKLGGTGNLKVQSIPRYASPEFQKYFKEFDDLLSSEYGESPYVEYMDTYMYGFWGEGHTWPFEKIGNPFGDPALTRNTFKSMFAHQCRNWKNVPLTTNTSPDIYDAGNDALIRETYHTNNWLRADTIYIYNQQIDQISNRSPWMGAALEVGMSDGQDEDIHEYEGQTSTDNKIQHVIDVGANYYSLWNWHQISADGILRYYEKYPKAIDKIAQKIGYRIRPSWIWHIERDGHEGLIFGLVNDGIAGVPGVVKLTLKTESGKIVQSGYLDPGFPKPSGVRQARMMLPKGVGWKGLRLFAEINIKGKLYPVQWASREKPNGDGSLTLKPISTVHS